MLKKMQIYRKETADALSKRTLTLFLILMLSLSFVACTDMPAGGNGDTGAENSAGTETEADHKMWPFGSGRESYSLSDIPDFDGSPYVILNDNRPDFTEEQKITDSFERYSPLDGIGRCGTAFANIGRDLMPTEKRGSIGMVKPSGWHLVKYDIVSGRYLYNRCHLIGYQLTAENANRRNLITGTRYLNVEGMLVFEDMVADYVKETGNHVLYRVTPVYKGDELVARGVEMEGWSVEDSGRGICFHVYCYNHQPGIEIDYATGESRLSEEEPVQQSGRENVKMEIRGNKRSGIYHCPGQRDYDKMEDSRNLILFESEAEAKKAGYRKAHQ